MGGSASSNSAGSMALIQESIPRPNSLIQMRLGESAVVDCPVTEVVISVIGEQAQDEQF